MGIECDQNLSQLNTYICNYRVLTSTIYSTVHNLVKVGRFSNMPFQKEKTHKQETRRFSTRVKRPSR